MKRIALLILYLSLFVQFSFSQNGIEIKTTEVGTLSKKLQSNEWFSLKSVKISGPLDAEDISFLSKYAQKDSGNLMEIDLSAAELYVIGNEALNNCNNLTKIILPQQLSAIGTSAFGGCSNLKTITLPKNLSAIGDYLFADCQNLETVELPNTIDKIPNGCFADCKNLKNINIPSNVKSIGKESFARCTELVKIEIPSNVGNIGGGAFTGCTKLESLKVNPNNKKYCSSAGGVLYSKDGKYILQYPAGKKVTTYTVPPGVVRIGSYSFAGCTTIKHITIPNSCTSIGYGAFYECTSLSDINIPNSINKIDEDLFYACSNLENITLPNSIRSIGQNAFYGCQKLKQINIPDNVIEIGEQSFSGCTNLISINIPANIKEIKNNTFENCTHLKNVQLPNSLTTIGILSFSNDSSIQNLIIPNSVNKIEYGAFSGCSNIKKITIPQNITIINDATFNKCSSLKSILLSENIDSVGMGAFAQCDSMKSIVVKNNNPPKAFFLAGYKLSDNVSLIVPNGKEDTYHEANGWNKFVHINDQIYPIEHSSPEPEMSISTLNSNDLNSKKIIYNTNSNDSSEVIKEDTNIYESSEVEQIAQFVDTKISFNDYLTQNYLHLQTNKFSVTFIIEKNGSISNVKILQSSGDDFDTEMISKIFDMPQLNPAIKNGESVRSRVFINL